jgi:hypothetical protein
MRQQSEELLEEGDSIEEELEELADLETPSGESESSIDPVDLLQIEVFTSSAVKNIGRFNCEFVKGEKLGRGAFGSAWRCYHLVDEQDYCVKEIRLAPSKFHGSAAQMVNYARGILREVSALSHCESHDNVVKYNAAWAEVVSERSLSGVAGEESEAGSPTRRGDENGEDDTRETSRSPHLSSAQFRSQHAPPHAAPTEQGARVSPVRQLADGGSGYPPSSLRAINRSETSWASQWSSDDAEWVRGEDQKCAVVCSPAARLLAPSLLPRLVSSAASCCQLLSECKSCSDRYRPLRLPS